MITTSKMKFKRASTLSYLLTLPSDYDKKEKLPMIVFLHGAGERGNNSDMLRTHGIPKLFGKDSDYNGERVITLSPQCPDGKVWLDFKDEVVGLIKRISKKYNVDENRITLTGISMGGFGTWEIAMSYPEIFAAICPMCSGGMSWRASALKMPIRVYHGRLDSVVPFIFSEIMVNAIKKCGGNVEFFPFDDLDHDCWTRAYEETDVINWLANAKK